MLTLDSLKAHLHLTSDSEDAYLADLIAAVEQYVADDLDIDSADLDDQPAPVAQACRLLAAHWYENRETVSSNGHVAHPVPLAYDSIISKYRNYSFTD